MADSKITELTELTEVADGDLLVIVDDPSGSPITKKITRANLVTGVGGGQTLYECVVAASGGDYTTVGDALTAGKTRIFVRNGTYTESAITTSTNDIVIVGESPNGAILSLGENSFTISGKNTLLQNLKFSTSTGVINWYSSNSRFLNCEITSSGTTNKILYSDCNNSVFSGNIVVDTSANVITTAANRVEIKGRECLVSNNYIKVRYGTTYGIDLYGNELQIIGNVFEVHTGANSKTFIRSGWSGCTFNSNYVHGDATSSGSTMVWASNGIVSSNYIYGGNTALSLGSTAVVSGNRLRPYTTGTGNQYGIYSTSHGGGVISGNYIYGKGTGSGFYGIYLNTSSVNDVVISGNHIFTVYIGIYLGGTVDCNVVGNTFDTIGSLAISTTSVNTNMVANYGDYCDTTMERKLITMKNTSGGSLAAGDVVTWKAVAAGNEVTTTTTGGDDLVFGMAVETINSNAWGKIQLTGKTTALKVDGTTDIAIGDFLSTFTTAKIAKKAADGETAFAIALEAYTADDSSGVIDALLITPRKVGAVV